MITFEDVRKTYGESVAVNDLDLSIPSNETTVIVGPSGCGKTTTLRLINRMLDPTSGVVAWDGRDVADFSVTDLRRKMGYVIQGGGLFPHRTVAENVGTVPRLLGWDRRRLATRAGELLELVGLDASMAQRYPAQLSGGQQQRVGVARALAADPLVLLMDEPFSAVDPVVRNDLQQMVKGLNNELGKTIVMITHDIDEAITLGDQVAVLEPGGVLAQVGSPADLLAAPASDFVEVFVGKDRGFRSLTFAPATELTLRELSGADDGRTFRLGGTVREALDEVLLSTSGLAVAVDDHGQRVGEIGAGEVVAVAERRLASQA